MKKGKKICLIIIISILALITVIAIVAVYIQSQMRVVDDIVINDIDLLGISDGIYFGRYETILVKAEVKVEVKDHSITSIEIIKHSHGKGEKAESIVNSILNEQRINVDVISGATISSKVILKAVENALTN